MKKNKKTNHILITGGGSGGHVAPIRAWIPMIQKKYPKMLFSWIGQAHFEEQAAQELDIDFYRINTGKLRRYFSWQNFLDLFKTKIAFIKSLYLLIKIKPTLVLSTGGFVSVPVVFAAWILRIPIISHEQTIALGLANKINFFFSEKCMIAFKESEKYTPQYAQVKLVHVPNPVRQSLIERPEKTLSQILNTKIEKPVLYITGGGQGASDLNEMIWAALPQLIKRYFVIHQCGKKFVEKGEKIMKEEAYKNDYVAVGFIGDDLMRPIYHEVEHIVCRSGAGTINELSHFKIPAILTPLRPTNNDEQYKNAAWYQEQVPSEILLKEDFSAGNLLDALSKLLKRYNESEGKEGQIKVKERELGTLYKEFSEVIDACLGERIS